MTDLEQLLSIQRAAEWERVVGQINAIKETYLNCDIKFQSFCRCSDAFIKDVYDLELHR